MTKICEELKEKSILKTNFNILLVCSFPSSGLPMSNKMFILQQPRKSKEGS